MKCEVAVIGAGPYGLAAVTHLRRAGVDAKVFGRAMSFWRTMPKGMVLRSNWAASNIAEPDGEFSLSAFERSVGISIAEPIPVDRFIEYGLWVQGRAAPDLDSRTVRAVDRTHEHFRLTLEDGEAISANRLVVACGIGSFAWRPAQFAGLASDLVSHTSEHGDPRSFAGRRVAVVGGGQSALEWAALLREVGAEVEVFARSSRLAWIRGMKKRLGPIGPVVYAPTDVGPLWYSRLVAAPDTFRRLPRRAQDRIARRCIRPAGAGWLVPRLRDVSIHLGATVSRAKPNGGKLVLDLSDGTQRHVDHLLLGTGYRVDFRHYSFLAPAILDNVRAVNGYPVLGGGLESSVPGLHFLGAAGAWSFGPIMRFVSGSWYSARSLAQHVVQSRHAAPIESQPARVMDSVAS
jgi:FAD-dependent urate hydroxylase